MMTFERETRLAAVLFRAEGYDMPFQKADPRTQQHYINMAKAAIEFMEGEK